MSRDRREDLDGLLKESPLPIHLEYSFAAARVLSGCCDSVLQFDPDDFSDAQQSIKAGSSQLVFDATDCGLGESGALGEHVHRDASAFTFLAQESNNMACQSFSKRVFGHSLLISRMSLTRDMPIGITMS
jgi:hypothetical protein